MNSNNKKPLIIIGLAVDLILTIGLFVFSILLIANLPSSRVEIDPNTLFGWFQVDPVRILIIDVIPLAVLLGINIFFTIRFLKGSEKKKKVALNDLSEEEKEALKKKILEEMMEKKEDSSENK